MNRPRNEFFVLRIRSCRRNLFAYIVCRAEKSTHCVVFFATRREKQTGRHVHLSLRLSGMQEIQQPNLRRAFREACAAIGARDGTT